MAGVQKSGPQRAACERYFGSTFRRLIVAYFPPSAKKVSAPLEHVLAGTAYTRRRCSVLLTPSTRVVRAPALRLADLLEAAINIRASQAADVAQILLRRHAAPHSVEVLVDFLMLSIATRQRVISRLLDQITQIEMMGATDADIIASVITLLQNLYYEGTRP